jgi:hypothetical protein
MRILIETVPFASIPNKQVGDWRRDCDGTLLIKVAAEIGETEAFLVAIHEAVEVILCEKHGVTCAQVDAFDAAYEKTRPENDFSEPGDSPDAPYRREHFTATNIERILAEALEVSWSDYENNINSL